jgi:hypothetical protein
MQRIVQIAAKQFCLSEKMTNAPPFHEHVNHCMMSIDYRSPRLFPASAVFRHACALEQLIGNALKS